MCCFLELTDAEYRQNARGMRYAIIMILTTLSKTTNNSGGRVK